MTNKIITGIIALLLISFNGFAQKAKTSKATFKVFGNCTQCKERIEASLDVSGVKSAEWDIETKEMVVIYNPAKITLERIHQLIANSGHDTDKAKAPEKVYNDLPGCCLYREHPNTHRD